MDLQVTGTFGCVLAGVDPTKGHFGSTSALEKGIQLKEHHSRIRGQYNLLAQKLDKSGFHSAHEELLRAAYDRTTEGNKVKDVGLLFYYLMVRDKDLNFLTSVLNNDENGEEVESEEKVDNETGYGKRQRLNKEKDSRLRSLADDKQISMMRSIMSPITPDNNYNLSMIAKNEQAVITSSKNASYLMSLTTTEATKVNIMEIDSIKSTLKDKAVESLLTGPQIQQLKDKLLVLMGLSPSTPAN